MEILPRPFRQSDLQGSPRGSVNCLIHSPGSAVFFSRAFHKLNISLIRLLVHTKGSTVAAPGISPSDRNGIYELRGRLSPASICTVAPFEARKRHICEEDKAISGAPACAWSDLSRGTITGPSRNRPSPHVPRIKEIILCPGRHGPNPVSISSGSTSFARNDTEMEYCQRWDKLNGGVIGDPAASCEGPVPKLPFLPRTSMGKITPNIVSSFFGKFQTRQASKHLVHVASCVPLNVPEAKPSKGPPQMYSRFNARSWLGS